MASPSFKREYCLAYEGQIGNVFTPMQIDEIVKLGNKYKDIPIDQMTIKSLAVDWGFSSSQTGIVLLEHINPSPREDKIIVRYTQIISKGDLNQICDKIWDFYLKYQNLYIFCDGSNRAATNLLKIKFGESLDCQPEEVNPQSMHILGPNSLYKLNSIQCGQKRIGSSSSSKPPSIIPATSRFEIPPAKSFHPFSPYYVW